MLLVFLKADLVQLAPLLKLSPQEICSAELKLILSFDSKLLVPSSSEFLPIFLARLKDVYVCDARDSLSLIELPGWATEYLEYLEKDFTNIEFNQSEKALACCFCAVARYSLKDQHVLSSAQEAEATKVALEVLLGESAPTGSSVNPLVLQLHTAWRTVAAHEDLHSICRVRCRFIERRIISAVKIFKGSSYPAASTDKENIIETLQLSQPGNTFVKSVTTETITRSQYSNNEAADIGRKNVANSLTPLIVVCVEVKGKLKKHRLVQRQQQINKDNIGPFAGASFSPKATSDLITDFEEEHKSFNLIMTKKRSASWSAGGGKRIKL